MSLNIIKIFEFEILGNNRIVSNFQQYVDFLLSDISKISFFTEVYGPTEKYVYLYLFKGNNVYAILQSIPDFTKVYDIVSKYNGFHLNSLQDALNSPVNNEYTCWHKKSPE